MKTLIISIPIVARKFNIKLSIKGDLNYLIILTQKSVKLLLNKGLIFLSPNSEQSF